MAAPVDNIGRRKFDLAQFEVIAKRKQDEEDELARETRKAKTGQLVQRDPLKQRSGELQLYKNVGKYQVITNTTVLSERGGFYCKDCDCLLKDSNTWLDHINGKKTSTSARNEYASGTRQFDPGEKEIRGA